tara:strand:+ start:2597 stop:2917 length:321 start_codon:yes stop_codon:yes gene_type:complete
MLDIGLLELLVIALVGLVMIGPDRLPEVLRGVGLFIGRLQRKFVSLKNDIEEEIGMDDIRRQLHNEKILDESKGIATFMEEPELPKASTINISPSDQINSKNSDND